LGEAQVEHVHFARFPVDFAQFTVNAQVMVKGGGFG